MGALTIKNYTFESRIWELKPIIFPNLLTSFPPYLLLYIKNTRIMRILPFNRNDFISNTTRFSYSFFNNILIKPSNDFLKTIINPKHLLFFQSILINYSFRLNFNGLLKDVKSLMLQEFYVLLQKKNFFLIPNYLIDLMEDDFNFTLFNNYLKTKFPDFFYYIVKDQFSFTEFENYDEEAIVEKGNRFSFFSKPYNFLFLWYIYQYSTDLLVYIMDLPVNFSIPKFYSIYNNNDYFYITTYLLENEFFYVNSFGLGITN